VERLVTGNVRRLTERVQQEGSELEEDEISLKTKVCLADQVSISERKKIIINVLSIDEGLTSFCWRVQDREGNKKCIN
jgi:hypothetical protein